MECFWIVVMSLMGIFFMDYFNKIKVFTAFDTFYALKKRPNLNNNIFCHKHKQQQKRKGR